MLSVYYKVTDLLFKRPDTPENQYDISVGTKS